tara:strand:- start:1534 stop:3126 length:1593 start_codon:yes stop_codon:yes gene_type:complete
MLADFKFDNRFLRSLPADDNSANYPRQVNGACYTRVKPKMAHEPVLIAYAQEVAELLDLNQIDCQSEEFLQMVVGNKLLEGMDPFATCYGGHQFGNWAGQLGDGRAINLGEVVNARNEHWNMQLKGAGPTPYSRMADGLAVFRSSVREFLCSEAMYHLGVPTTRALSLALTGEQVMRDIFYDGNPALEPGAVVCRVSSSFLRFGHFEILAARGELENLRKLADYALKTEFPDLIEGHKKISKEHYAALFKAISSATLKMIIEWSRVGFVHGVMNTDNMSVAGLTIDYGPYGWMEDFDFDWTPNTTDAEGRRYCFGNQAGIGQWNLLQLAQALVTLTHDPAPFEAILAEYTTEYKQQWLIMMGNKLGLGKEGTKDQNETLFKELLEVLKRSDIDMTIFFRLLSKLSPGDSTEKCFSIISDSYYDLDGLSAEDRGAMERWLFVYLERVRYENVNKDERIDRMNAMNPLYILRNYLVQRAIEQGELGDFSGIHDLLDLIRKPYEYQAGRDRFAEKRPEWARDKAGCSMLSCSS